MSINIQNGKTYVTSGGWVVEIFSISHYGREYFFATQKTSPGTIGTKLVADWAKDNYVTWAQNCGWEYLVNGTLKISGSGDLMKKDLEIVGEYPAAKLPDLPDGYKWAGGFPKIEDMTRKGHWLTIGGSILVDFVPEIVSGIGAKRIRLEKVTASPPAPPQYYMTDTVDTNGIPTFYIYKNNKWFYKSKNGEGEALATEDQIRSYVREGKYKSITEEEINKLLNPPPNKDIASVYPKYYIRTNGELYDGAIVVERISEEDYRLLGENRRVIFTDGYWCQAASFVKEKIWIEVSKQEANRLIAGGEPLLKYYARSNGARFTDGLVICRDWNDKCVTLEGKKTTPEYDWGARSRHLYDESWKEISRSEAIALLNNGETKSPPEVVSVPLVSVKKEEEMSGNTSKDVVANVITSGASKIAKSVDYLYIQPAKIIGGYVKRSLRYIVFTGTIAGLIYGANNPDDLKKRIASVLPKVTIEAPSLLK